MSCSLKTRLLAGFLCPGETVGISLLAMDSSTLRLSSLPALSLTTIAGKPAPTMDRVCRSQLAGDGLQGAAFNQVTRVFVSDHRQQAGSYTVVPMLRPVK